MKKSKKIIAAIIISALALLFTACGEKAAEEPSTDGAEIVTGAAAAQSEPKLSPETVSLGLDYVTDADESAEYQKVIVGGDSEGVKDTTVSKTGMFCILQDRFYDAERYYVWGYGDDARSTDWQWEFVPADASALPAQGSVITVTGTLKETDKALDRLRIEDAAVSVDSEYSADSAYDVDCRFMGSTLERVQVQNVSLNPADFGGKTFAVYGRSGGAASVRNLYDGAEGAIIEWALEYGTAYENPEQDTPIIVTGTLDGEDAVMHDAEVSIFDI